MAGGIVKAARISDLDRQTGWRKLYKYWYLIFTAGPPLHHAAPILLTYYPDSWFLAPVGCR